VKTIKPQNLTLTLWLSLTIFLNLNLAAVWAEISFLPPQDISQNPDMINTLPTLALDQEGNVHTAYLGGFFSPGAPDSLEIDIFYTNNVGGDFKPPMQISVPTDFYSKDVSIAADNQGNAHLVFRRSKDQTMVQPYDDIYYVNNIGGEFNEPEMIVDGRLGGEFSGPSKPSIGVDDTGTVHIIFNTSFEGLFYMQGATGHFSKPINISAPYKPSGIGDPQLVVDHADKIHVAFFGYQQLGDDLILYVNNLSGGFSTPEVALEVYSCDYGPALAVDNDGNDYIATRDDSPGLGVDLVYVTNKSGRFSDRIIIDSSIVPVFLPSIDVDSAGVVHVVYKLAGDCQCILYANNSSGEFASIETGYDMGLAGLPWFAVDEERGLLHLTFDSGAKVYYACGVSPMVGTINGSVKNLLTREPLRALVISINDETKEKKQAISDPDNEGYYEITNLEPGLYWVLGIKKGYKLSIRTAEVVADDTTIVPFRLRPELELKYK
jgi:hypothetical protein